MNETFSVIPKETNDLIDAVEAKMVIEMVGSGEFEFIDCPLRHVFTDGLYAREITMPAGARITSRIHKTEHQFIISEGVVSVFNDGVEEVLVAPYLGITKAGTRRVLLVHTKTTWTTFHPNPNNENLEQIANRIIEKHDNQLLTKKEKKEINY